MTEIVDKSYNWVLFSQSYLRLALLGCQELLDGKHKKSYELTLGLRYNIEDLFIPIIYNTKHGIEIFIKTFKFILDEKLGKDDRNHNSLELFEAFKKEIRKNKDTIIKEIKAEFSKKPESANLEVADKDLNNIEAFLNSLSQIIEKYHHCEFLKNKISNNFEIEDHENTAFRYPENNLKITLDYGSILSELKREDIEEIKKDVTLLFKIFNDLGFIFDVYKDLCKK